MAKTNRETLKGYFGSGRIPTGRHFEDLVDSMLNIVDDGMNKSAGNGLQLSPLEEKGPVLEFFGNVLDEFPLWKVMIDRKSGGMCIQKGDEDEPTLTLYPDKKIELQGNVELSGTLKAAGFIGNYKSGQVPANGVWQDITEEPEGELPGCRAYRVIAGCGKKGKGKYALLEATALHCYGSHRRIRSLQSWFGIHFNRLRLRWHKQGETWRLQVRTRCDYGEDAMIRFQVSELWQDHYFSTE